MDVANEGVAGVLLPLNGTVIAILIIKYYGICF